MTNPLVCHFLIGPPGCGKSTLAKQWIAWDKTCRWVSTDKIRQQIFGDNGYQGNWTIIEAEVVKQVQQALKERYSVVYDATNAKPSWRRLRLQQFAECGKALWIAWVFQTPLDICKKQNLYRKGTELVPNEVIEEYFQVLQEFPPQIEEGFAEIYLVPTINGLFDFSQINEKITQVLINL